jgi:hypothetical protein
MRVSEGCQDTTIPAFRSALSASSCRQIVLNPLPYPTDLTMFSPASTAGSSRPTKYLSTCDNCRTWKVRCLSSWGPTLLLHVPRGSSVTEDNPEDEACILCNVCQYFPRQVDQLLQVAYLLTPETRTAMHFLTHESTKIAHIKVCKG